MAFLTVNNPINYSVDDETPLIEDQQSRGLPRIKRLILVFFFYVVCQRVVFYTAVMTVDDEIRADVWHPVGWIYPNSTDPNSTVPIFVVTKLIDVKGLVLSACCLLSIVGGLAADTLWNNSYLLTFGGIAHLLAMVLLIIGLARAFQNIVVSVLSVVILAVGSSVCRSTVYVFGAHHFGVRNQEQLTFYTSVYYWFTIVGEFIGIRLAYLCTDRCFDVYGICLALGIVSLLLFLWFRNKFRERSTDQTYLFGVCRWLRCKLPTGLTAVESNTLKRNTLVSVPLFAIMACCMMCVFHLKYASTAIIVKYGTISYQDSKMDAMVCDVIIAMFIPILWGFIRNNGLLRCPFLRIKVGMVCSILGVLYVGTMPYFPVYNSHISATFKLDLLILPRCAFASMAETLLYPSGYEICWKHSDKRLKATMLGFFTMSWGVSGLTAIFLTFASGGYTIFLNFGYGVMQLLVLIFYFFYCRVVEANNA